MNALRRTVAAAAMSAVLLATACSSPEDSVANPGADAAFTAFAAPIHEEARAGGASDGQLALIERTIAEGWVSPAVVEEALAETFACFEEAGIQVWRDPVAAGVELPEISYSYRVSDPSDPIADACLTEHSMWVEMMYQVQPKAVESTDSLFEQHREYLIECLRGFGRDLDDDASVGEIKDALLPTPEEVEARTNDPADTGEFLSLSCADDVGIDGF